MQLAGLEDLDHLPAARGLGKGASFVSRICEAADMCAYSCSRWVPGMLVAAFRKACCRKSPTAERFGMSSLGELGTIGLYILFNILLTVLGGTSRSAEIIQCWD